MRGGRCGATRHAFATRWLPEGPQCQALQARADALSLGGGSAGPSGGARARRRAGRVASRRPLPRRGDRALARRRYAKLIPPPIRSPSQSNEGSPSATLRTTAVRKLAALLDLPGGCARSASTIARTGGMYASSSRTRPPILHARRDEPPVEDRGTETRARRRRARGRAARGSSAGAPRARARSERDPRASIPRPLALRTEALLLVRGGRDRLVLRAAPRRTRASTRPTRSRASPSPAAPPARATRARPTRAPSTPTRPRAGPAARGGAGPSASPRAYHRRAMAKRALITGIGGQDGSLLAELLLENGYEVSGSSGRRARATRTSTRSASGSTSSRPT